MMKNLFYSIYKEDKKQAERYPACFCLFGEKKGLFKHQFSFKNNKKNVNIQFIREFFSG